MRDVIVLDMMKHGIKNQIIPTKAVDFSLLKSRDPVGFQDLPALAHGMAHMRLYYAPASWKLGAASWERAAAESELEAGYKKFNKVEAGSYYKKFNTSLTATRPRNLTKMTTVKFLLNKKHVRYI